jgi:hypothetical protein
VTAARRYEVRLTRYRDRVDSVEVVDLDDGEVVLFWDREAREASRLAEALRADLLRMESEEFLARWAAEQE